MSELQKELTKSLRGQGNGKHIAEEMADVQIMLKQLNIIFNNELQVGSWRAQKIGRLDKRLHGGNEDNKE